MDTWGEKDLCLFWEWAQEYFGRSGQNGPFFQHWSVAQNAGSWHTIFETVFEKGQLRLYYGVSHRGAARDESGDFGPWNVGIIHVFQWDWHLGW